MYVVELVKPEAAPAVVTVCTPGAGSKTSQYPSETAGSSSRV